MDGKVRKESCFFCRYNLGDILRVHGTTPFVSIPASHNPSPLNAQTQSPVTVTQTLVFQAFCVAPTCRNTSKKPLVKLWLTVVNILKETSGSWLTRTLLNKWMRTAMAMGTVCLLWRGLSRGTALCTVWPLNVGVGVSREIFANLWSWGSFLCLRARTRTVL